MSSTSADPQTGFADLPVELRLMIIDNITEWSDFLAFRQIDTTNVALTEKSNIITARRQSTLTIDVLERMDATLETPNVVFAYLMEEMNLQMPSRLLDGLEQFPYTPVAQPGTTIQQELKLNNIACLVDKICKAFAENKLAGRTLLNDHHRQIIDDSYHDSEPCLYHDEDVTLNDLRANLGIVETKLYQLRTATFVDVVQIDGPAQTEAEIAAASIERNELIVTISKARRTVAKIITSVDRLLAVTHFGALQNLTDPRNHPALHNFLARFLNWFAVEMWQPTAEQVRKHFRDGRRMFVYEQHVGSFVDAMVYLRGIIKDTDGYANI